MRLVWIKSAGMEAAEKGYAKPHSQIYSLLHTIYHVRELEATSEERIRGHITGDAWPDEYMSIRLYPCLKDRVKQASCVFPPKNPIGIQNLLYI